MGAGPYVTRLVQIREAKRREKISTRRRARGCCRSCNCVFRQSKGCSTGESLRRQEASTERRDYTAVNAAQSQKRRCPDTMQTCVGGVPGLAPDWPTRTAHCHSDIVCSISRDTHWHSVFFSSVTQRVFSSLVSSRKGATHHPCLLTSSLSSRAITKFWFYITFVTYHLSMNDSN